MRAVTKHMLLVALTVTACTAAVITTNAAGQTTPTVIRLIVPLN